MTSRRRLLLATAAAAAAGLVLAGCGGSDDPLADPGDGGSTSAGSSPTIRVGSGNFDESKVLAEIYAGALEAKGVKVDTRLNIGNREVYLKAITDPDNPGIDVFPEYTASLRNYFKPDLPGTTPDEVYAELKANLPDGLTVLPPAQAQDQDAVVVTKETAQKYSLSSIGDLQPVAGQLKLGGPPEWKTRSTGVPGLKKKYDVTFGEFKVLDAGGKLSHDGLVNHQVDAANIFTTDPDVASGKLVALDDPENLFASENVVPLVRTAVLDDTITKALNGVSAALTQDKLLALVDEVVAQKKDPEDVASEFLTQNGLA